MSDVRYNLKFKHFINFTQFIIFLNKYSHSFVYDSVIHYFGAFLIEFGDGLLDYLRIFKGPLFSYHFARRGTQKETIGGDTGGCGGRTGCRG